MSKIEVDAIDKQSGSTLTLGRCGGTVALASGATQTGFGRTGTVDWQTGSIKTSTFTAANGEGYFADTSSGGFTMNLPAGTAGNIVSVVDYTNTFQTNNLTITPNGSQKIGGVAAGVTLSTEGQSVTLVYVDDTEGWKNVQDSTSNVTGSQFIVATGGTVTTSGNCKIHSFTGPGTFAVSSIHPCAANNQVSYMVVGGGGAGGLNVPCNSGMGGAGGAGGFREDKSPVTPYIASPLDGAPAISVTATSFPITVGAGGAGITYPSNANTPANPGSVSTFSTVTSAGGGGGGNIFSASSHAGGDNGGSGGGSSQVLNSSGTPGGGNGNTPSTSPPQGQNGGGSGPNNINGSGGGGGAGGTGANGVGPIGSGTGGAGGAGVSSCITGSPVGYAGGGGGAGSATRGAANPVGGGGQGMANPDAPYASNVGTAGTVNTGGGGGGLTGPNPAYNSASCGSFGGGSGIVVIRYKFQ